MKSSRPAYRVPVVLLVALCLVLTGSPAQAATKTFKDRKGDAASRVDVRKVKVVHGKRAVRIVVRVQNLRYNQDALDGVRVHFDATKRRSGPEYMASVGGFHSYFFKMRKWRAEPRANDPYGDIGCRFRVKYDVKKNLVTFRVPRKCLGSPKKFRVNVATDHSDSSGKVLSSDYSPKRKAFHRWVERG